MRGHRFLLLNWLKASAREGVAARTIVLLVLAGVTLAPPSAQALSIGEALTLASSANPTVRAAREAAHADYDAVAVARAAWLPMIYGFATAGIAYNWLDTTAIKEGDSSGYSDTAQVTLGLVYDHSLYRGGADTAALGEARRGARRSIAEAEDVQQSVLLRVATAYLDALRAKRTVALREEALAAFEERVREAQVLFEVGERTRSDVAQAEAERAVAASVILSARTELEIERALLEKLVGREPGVLEMAGEPPGTLLPATLQDARRSAEQFGPSVRVAQHALHAAEYAVRVVEGEARPTIDLVGAVTMTGRRDHGQRFLLPGTPLTEPDSAATEHRADISAGVRVKVPIYQAGAVKARLSRAQRIYLQRREEWSAARLEAAQGAERAWRKRATARDLQAALGTAVEASETALEHIRLEADVGKRTLREVLDAQRVLVERRIDALAAEGDGAVEAYRLLQAVGGLTVRNLRSGGLH